MHHAINFLLLLVAIFLFVVVTPFGIVFKLIVAFRRGSLKEIIAYLSESAISLAYVIDIMGAVVNSDLLNATLIKGENKYPFGSYKELLSAGLGENKRRGTLSKPGRILANFLNLLDKNHVENALKNSPIAHP